MFSWWKTCPGKDVRKNCASISRSLLTTREQQSPNTCIVKSCASCNITSKLIFKESRGTSVIGIVLATILWRLTQKNPCFRMRSFWEQSSDGSWLYILGVRDISGTGPEWNRTCGFRMSSTNLERTPKMRLSVLLNSWDNIIVTLPQSLPTPEWYSPLVL